MLTLSRRHIGRPTLSREKEDERPNQLKKGQINNKKREQLAQEHILLEIFHFIVVIVIEKMKKCSVTA